jgi:tetratricopeptide (TPR) repeat protein
VQPDQSPAIEEACLLEIKAMQRAARAEEKAAQRAARAEEKAAQRAARAEEKAAQRAARERQRKLEIDSRERQRKAAKRWGKLKKIRRSLSQPRKKCIAELVLTFGVIVLCESMVLRMACKDGKEGYTAQCASQEPDAFNPTGCDDPSDEFGTLATCPATGNRRSSYADIQYCLSHKPEVFFPGAETFLPPVYEAPVALTRKQKEGKKQYVEALQLVYGINPDAVSPDTPCEKSFNARNLLAKAQESCPDDPSIPLLWGIANLRVSRVKDALVKFHYAVERAFEAGDYETAWLAFSYIYVIDAFEAFKLKNFSKTFEKCSQALEWAPNNIDALYYITGARLKSFGYTEENIQMGVESLEFAQFLIRIESEALGIDLSCHLIDTKHEDLLKMQQRKASSPQPGMRIKS